jgi:hypothetical protein
MRKSGAVSAVLWLASVGAWAAPAAPTEDALRAAVQDSERRLGELEPWQRALFQDEVVPQYARFVKGFRPTGTGMQVDVDVDAVRRYLTYRASKAPAKFLVALRPEENCAPCAESAKAIRGLVEARLKRRGFSPVFVGTDEVGDPKLAGKLLDEKVVELLGPRAGSGALVLEWRLAPTDNIDTAHADEKRYLVRLFTLAREEGTGGVGSGKVAREAKTESSLEFLEADGFERATARLLTDSFTEFGAKWLAAASLGDAEQPELSISVTGIRDFAHFTAVKARLQAGLQTVLAPGTSLEDRRIARGRAVFGVRTPGGVEEVKPLVVGLTLEKGVLALIDADASARSIQLEVR